MPSSPEAGGFDQLGQAFDKANAAEETKAAGTADAAQKSIKPPKPEEALAAVRAKQRELWSQTPKFIRPDAQEDFDVAGAKLSAIGESFGEESEAAATFKGKAKDAQEAEVWRRVETFTGFAERLNALSELPVAKRTEAHATQKLNFYLGQVGDLFEPKKGAMVKLPGQIRSTLVGVLDLIFLEGEVDISQKSNAKGAVDGKITKTIGSEDAAKDVWFAVDKVLSGELDRPDGFIRLQGERYASNPRLASAMEQVLRSALQKIEAPKPPEAPKSEDDRAREQLAAKQREVTNLVEGYNIRPSRNLREETTRLFHQIGVLYADMARISEKANLPNAAHFHAEAEDLKKNPPAIFENPGFFAANGRTIVKEDALAYLRLHALNVPGTAGETEAKPQRQEEVLLQAFDSIDADCARLEGPLKALEEGFNSKSDAFAFARPLQQVISGMQGIGNRLTAIRAGGKVGDILKRLSDDLFAGAREFIEFGIRIKQNGSATVAGEFSELRGNVPPDIFKDTDREHLAKEIIRERTRVRTLEEKAAEALHRAREAVLGKEVEVRALVDGYAGQKIREAFESTTREFLARLSRKLEELGVLAKGAEYPALAQYCTGKAALLRGRDIPLLAQVAGLKIRNIPDRQAKVVALLSEGYLQFEAAKAAKAPEVPIELAGSETPEKALLAKEAEIKTAVEQYAGANIPAGEFESFSRPFLNVLGNRFGELAELAAKAGNEPLAKTCRICATNLRQKNPLDFFGSSTKVFADGKEVTPPPPPISKRQAKLVEKLRSSYLVFPAEAVSSATTAPEQLKKVPVSLGIKAPISGGTFNELARNTPGGADKVLENLPDWTISLPEGKNAEGVDNRMVWAQAVEKAFDGVSNHEEFIARLQELESSQSIPFLSNAGKTSSELERFLAEIRTEYVEQKQAFEKDRAFRDMEKGEKRARVLAYLATLPRPLRPVFTRVMLHELFGEGVTPAVEATLERKPLEAGDFVRRVQDGKITWSSPRMIDKIRGDEATILDSPLSFPLSELYREVELTAFGFMPAEKIPTKAPSPASVDRLPPASLPPLAIPVGADGRRTAFGAFQEKLKANSGNVEAVFDMEKSVREASQLIEAVETSLSQQIAADGTAGRDVTFKKELLGRVGLLKNACEPALMASKTGQAEFLLDFSRQLQSILDEEKPGARFLRSLATETSASSAGARVETVRLSPELSGTSPAGGGGAPAGARFLRQKAPETRSESGSATATGAESASETAELRVMAGWPQEKIDALTFAKLPDLTDDELYAVIRSSKVTQFGWGLLLHAEQEDFRNKVRRVIIDSSSFEEGLKEPSSYEGVTQEAAINNAKEGLKEAIAVPTEAQIERIKALTFSDLGRLLEPSLRILFEYFGPRSYASFLHGKSDDFREAFIRAIAIPPSACEEIKSLLADGDFVSQEMSGFQENILDSARKLVAEGRIALPPPAPASPAAGASQRPPREKRSYLNRI